MSQNRLMSVLKNLVNFKQSNLVGDVTITNDNSIDVFERLLMRIYLISNSSEAMNGQKPINRRRRRIGQLVKWLFVIQLIRSTLCFYAKYWFQDQLMSDILCDYFALAGIGGDVKQFWNLIFSLININLYNMMAKAEKNRQLDILTDFSSCSQLVSSSLSPKETRLYRKTTKVFLLVVNMITIIELISCYVFHTYAFYISYSIRGTPILFVAYTLSLIAIGFWIYATTICFTVPPLYLFFSAFYVGLRYRSLHQKIKHSMANKCNNLDYLLKEFHEIAQFVEKHHVFTKWIMFIFNYYCSMITAVSIVVPIYGNFDSVLFRMAVIVTAVQQVMIMIFFAGVAGSVHQNVSLYT